MTETSRIAAAIGMPDALYVIDTRRDPVELRHLSWRPWLREGAVDVLLQGVTAADPGSIVERVSRDTAPLAVIVGFEDPLWSVFSEQLAASDLGTGRVVQVVDHGGRLVMDAVDVPQRVPIDRSRSTLLTVSARRTLDVRDVDLPCQVELDIIGGEARVNVLRVSATSRFDHNGVRLPEPAWLRIVGPVGVSHVTLKVDVTPRSDRDEWRFEIEPSGFTVEQIAAPPSFNAHERVAFVLDRTCPDDGRWGDALAVAVNRYDGATPLSEFNIEIRRALEEGLAGYDWAPGARGALYWFADIPGDGVAGVKKGPPITVGWGARSEFGLPDGASEALSGLGYIPGLDLWDPVGEAVALATDFFRQHGAGTLLIVGNSPPRVRTMEGPFRDVARTFGFPTTWRSASDQWAGALGALARLGVDVYYLFLRHGGAGPATEREHHAFEAIQSRVEIALRTSLDGRVVGTRATASGVRTGLVEILNRARSVEFGPSGLEVVNVKRA